MVPTCFVKADAIKAGDVLLERWQRRGIGHTIPVMRAMWVESDRLELVVESGSMPRRYAKWEEGPAAGRYFKDESAGGPGENPDGDAYAALGGGLRRWRVPTVEAGRYRNTFLNGERSLWINSSDKEAIAQRTDDFSNFVRPPSPEEQQRVALDLVESARAHLSRYPASCSARKNREAAFEELRTVNQMHFGLSPDATDAQYRVLDDYVFETLVYDDSVTCCWNSTTSAMYEIIMDYNYWSRLPLRKLHAWPRCLYGKGSQRPMTAMRFSVSMQPCSVACPNGSPGPMMSHVLR